MERYVFTSGYIISDYKMIRDKLSKNFMLAEPIKKIGGDDFPVIQGSAFSPGEGCEWKELCEELNGLKTSFSVRFVVIPCYSEDSPIYIIEKDAEGNVDYHTVIKTGNKCGDSCSTNLMLF